MMPEVLDIKTFTPKASDVFLFDNSVWMYLYCPLGNYNQQKQKAYSGFFKQTISSRSTIFTNSMVISEFSNRFLRLDFEEWKKKQKEIIKPEYKKDYVGTQQYKDTVAELTIYIGTILKYAQKGNDNFSSINLDHVMNHFQQIDFNDSYLLELAQQNNYILVTDDKDFINYQQHKVRVITILN